MDEKNEELNEMDEDRRLRLAEQTGKEALKKQQKKDAVKQMIKMIIKAIVAKIQVALIVALLTSIIVILVVTLISSLFDGTVEDPVYVSPETHSKTTALTLREYLVQFSHSGEAPQSDDGRFYKMYSDDPTSGWPTIGDSDLQWKSHQSQFACQGKVKKATGENTESDVQAYVNGLLTRGADAKYSQTEIDTMAIYIEKDLVDKVGQSIAEGYYQAVVEETKDLNLSQQQLYALTAIKYNFGNLPRRPSGSGGKTFKEVYEEGAGLYAINSWEHMRYIWDNWWCLLGGGAAGHIPSRDAAYETFVKGIFDFTYSPAGEVFGRSYYIYYTQEQIDRFDYAPDKPITRTDENEQEIFTYQELVAGSFDGTTVTAAGYTFPHYLQRNFDRAYGSSTIKAAGCGPTSMAMILAGLCNDFSITPITFVDNMYEYYKDWHVFYLPGSGSYWGPLCKNEFLQKYYNCKSTAIGENDMTGMIEAVSQGKCVIGAEKGHILAILPLPDEYKAGGYSFFVLDSARGHSRSF